LLIVIPILLLHGAINHYKQLSLQQGQEEKDDEDFPIMTAVGAQENPGQEAAVDKQGLEDKAASQYKQTIRPTSTYSSMKQMTRGPG
jgi:hypothetical protein